MDFSHIKFTIKLKKKGTEMNTTIELPDSIKEEIFKNHEHEYQDYHLLL